MQLGAIKLWFMNNKMNSENLRLVKKFFNVKHLLNCILNEKLKIFSNKLNIENLKQKNDVKDEEINDYNYL